VPIYKRFENINLTQDELDFLKEIREIESTRIYKNYSFSRDFLTKEYETVEHIWSHGDKLYKLANRYFGDRNLFWIIGLFNNKPTDSHFTYGDIVYVPVQYIEFLRDVVK